MILSPAPNAPPPSAVHEPDQIWWTALELANANLPVLPKTKQNMNAWSKREDWGRDPRYARRRAGRGGAIEYHWELLPQRAKELLLMRAIAKMPKPEVSYERDGGPRHELWAAYDGRTDAVKKRAKKRLLVIQRVEALCATGSTKRDAVTRAASEFGFGDRIVFDWFALIEGVTGIDRLPYLAPKTSSQKRLAQIKLAPCDTAFWDALKADYLRPEQPTFTSCYRRITELAALKGWRVLEERTARRRLAREVSKTTTLLARKGMDALKSHYPAQTRDKLALHAMEAVNADYHKWDVFVKHPSNDKPVRMQMVAFQDIYSGRVLAFRHSLNPNKDDVALTLGDMIEAFGLPDHLLFDNGREFANKFLTGQAVRRNRFKALEHDIPGLAKSLDINVHFATPYSGQSKPIERAFRDMCDDIARDPRFAGAWVGNRPDAKPENYASKAIPLDTFLEVVSDGIARHNARTGRRSQVAAGRSFIEAFDASYATAPIRKATEAQRRMWLMGAEGVKADTRTGLIRFQGNEYWADWMSALAGQRVVVRFDPADLWAGVHVYTLANAYLGQAPCKLKAGFFDVDAAKTHAHDRRDWMRKERAALDAARKLKTSDLATMWDTRLGEDAPAVMPPKVPEAKVIRPLFGTAGMVTAQPNEELSGAHEALIADFEAARVAKIASAEPADTDMRRFRRALEIEARLAGGEPVPRDQEHWLSIYQNEPEYRGLMHLYEDFGEQMFGGDGG